MACKRWTYGGDPANSNRDAIRFLIGDTIAERPLLDDKEVDYLLTKSADLTIVAAEACEALYSRFVGISDYTVGSVSKKYSDVAAKFKARADEFRTDAYRNARVSFPAHLISEKSVLQADGDLKTPDFSVGLGDSPWATQINTDLSELWRTHGW